MGNLTLLLLLVNIIGILSLGVLPDKLNRLYGYVALLAVSIMFWVSLFMWVSFSTWTGGLQGLVWYGDNRWGSVNLSFMTGIDGVSLYFLLLTTLLFPLCILAGWDVENRKNFMLILTCMVFFIILAFAVLDLFFFCLFFESLLLPMIFIMLQWGTQERKTAALTYLYMYTLIGSVFILLALFMLYFEVKTTSYLGFIATPFDFSGSETAVLAIWLLLFFSFAIKVPILPVHIWLPEAHVEAPTVGSVILAALLLKLGGYGILRFLVSFCEPLNYFEAFACMFCAVSVLYGSLMAAVQKDMKRIIAYSSVAHMNFAMFGYFTHNIYGLTGATCLMISHGIVSSALFFLIGVLYTRYGCRDVPAFGGLVIIMPLFITLFFIFIISNFSFPGTSNFVGELYVLVGLMMHLAVTVLGVALLSTFYGVVYSMGFFSNISFGSLKLPRNAYAAKDIVRLEFYTFAPLVGMNFYFGIAPTLFLMTLHSSLVSLGADFENSKMPVNIFDNRRFSCVTEGELYFDYLSLENFEGWTNTYYKGVMDTIYSTDLANITAGDNLLLKYEVDAARMWGLPWADVYSNFSYTDNVSLLPYLPPERMALEGPRADLVYYKGQLEVEAPGREEGQRVPEQAYWQFLLTPSNHTAGFETSVPLAEVYEQLFAMDNDPACIPNNNFVGYMADYSDQLWFAHNENYYANAYLPLREEAARFELVRNLVTLQYQDNMVAELHVTEVVGLLDNLANLQVAELDKYFAGADATVYEVVEKQ